ncbi:MerR family transcriptional regulator [Bombella saccharophila]|uniref:MerR family transcriptional regulator n=1 Tax=Bombella saccharophila TaxID=2967338 RepID=A0ABT3W5H3_9PROT|nr:MerR family transcriptional regulator [Bombella saccharophila]MCX5614320.1 MerR family transcriptional regulator [Bombella saccharophila]
MTSTNEHHLSHETLRPALSVAEELGLPLYRLRSWESLYPVFKTEQRDDGQSYYDGQAVNIVRHIARLLYQEGAKSHEIVARLQREGIIGGEDSKATSHAQMHDDSEPQQQVASPSAAETDVAALTERLAVLERDNKALEVQVEEFGPIALSLKSLEDENAALKNALEEASVTTGEEKSSAYLQELEESNLTLQGTVERLTMDLKDHHHQAELKAREQETALAAMREKLALAQSEREQGEALQKKLSQLQEDNNKLREAVQRLQGEHEVQLRAGAEQQSKLESEKHMLVQKLEQSVLLMQSLEDENVRLKRSLKERETKQAEQGKQQEGLNQFLRDVLTELGQLKQLIRG